MPRLGVNIDHIATLRQARGTFYPDPVAAALICERAGADQIVCHLREDRRHIQDADLFSLRQSIHIPLNLEMAATDEMTRIALQAKPDRVTLVPERRQEMTTEGGLDLTGHAENLKRVIETLQDKNIPVSLFIHPSLEDVEQSTFLGARAIEIHTGRYADLPLSSNAEELARILQAARRGVGLNLEVFAGHGLHLQNTEPLLQIAEIQEYNIGHSIIARAVFVGLEEAVREMKQILTS